MELGLLFMLVLGLLGLVLSTGVALAWYRSPNVSEGITTLVFVAW